MSFALVSQLHVPHQYKRFGQIRLNFSIRVLFLSSFRLPYYLPLPCLKLTNLPHPTATTRDKPTLLLVHPRLPTLPLCKSSMNTSLSWLTMHIQWSVLFCVDNIHTLPIQCQCARCSRPQRCCWYGRLLWRPRSTPRWYVGVPSRQHLWSNW